MELFLLALLACTPSPDDLDGDGYLAGEGSGADCDDTVSSIHPGAEEHCDGIDEDCDGEVDEDATDAKTYYLDADGDEQGDPDVAMVSCEQPWGYQSNHKDCDDTDPDVNDRAEEVCNGVDDDCDGLVDEKGDESWFDDADGDGWGDSLGPEYPCGADGRAPRDGDCDDSDASINPGADELCDGLDQDCDDEVDEDPVDGQIWYQDLDGDGWGDPSVELPSCEEPEGWVAQAEDCVDLNSAVHPDAVEVCNGLDDDCDGLTDGSDAWWDEGWPYRIPLELTGSSSDLQAAPAFVDVDLDQALVDLGSLDQAELGSVRLILQDCALGQPEVPSQVVDEWADLFGSASPAEDGTGLLALRYDEDGDLSTSEALLASSTASLALYFDTHDDVSSWSSATAASTTHLDTGTSTARFANDGLVYEITTRGSTDTSHNLADQSLASGNGAWTGSWDVGRQGSVTVLEQGPVLVAVRGQGTREDEDGAFAWSYTWWGLAGRPELWVRAQLQTTDASSLSWPVDAAEGISPWASESSALAEGTASDDATLEWADLSGGGWGLAWGYLQAPTHVVGLEDDAGVIRSLASDALPAGGGSPVVVASGTTLFDTVMVVWPHEGDYADVSDEFQAVLDGVEVVLGDPEAL